MTNQNLKKISKREFTIITKKKGYTPEEALEEANKKGYKEPILTKIPKENRSYLL